MVELAHVEEMVKRISDQKGVTGVVIANGQGVPVRSTMDNENTVQYGASVAQISRQARSFIREMGPDDDLQYIRLRTCGGREVMIAPNFDGKYQLSLTVIQDASSEVKNTTTTTISSNTNTVP